MLSCLNGFDFDRNRNEYVRSISRYIQSIQGNEFLTALSMYDYDSGRNEFVSMIFKYVVDAEKYLTTILHLYESDNGREFFLETYCDYYVVDPMQFGAICGCFDHGFTNFGLLISKAPLRVIAQNIDHVLNKSLDLPITGSLTDDKIEDPPPYEQIK